LPKNFIVSARPSYVICTPYQEILVNWGARFTETPRSRCGQQKAAYLNSRLSDVNYSNPGYDESTSVTCKIISRWLFLIPTECSSEVKQTSETLMA